MRHRWTARQVEALGLGCLVLGVAFWSLPAALIAGGVLLILGAYVRVGHG